jgi:hypothetical protein
VYEYIPAGRRNVGPPRKRWRESALRRTEQAEWLIYSVDYYYYYYYYYYYIS